MDRRSTGACYRFGAVGLEIDAPWLFAQISRIGQFARTGPRCVLPYRAVCYRIALRLTKLSIRTAGKAVPRATGPWGRRVGLTRSAYNPLFLLGGFLSRQSNSGLIMQTLTQAPAELQLLMLLPVQRQGDWLDACLMYGGGHEIQLTQVVSAQQMAEQLHDTSLI